MQTKIVISKGRITLNVGHLVLASMILYEGTKCWSLIDIRLSNYKSPSEYLCHNADDYCASYKPENNDELLHIKSRLREYRILGDGEVLWCSFDGIVRGQPTVNGYAPKHWQDFNQSGYFSKKDGLDYIRELKKFWDNVSEQDFIDKNWRIDNPHAQPTLAQLQTEMHFIRSGHKDLIKN